MKQQRSLSTPTGFYIFGIFGGFIFRFLFCFVLATFLSLQHNTTQHNSAMSDATTTTQSTPPLSTQPQIRDAAGASTSATSVPPAVSDPERCQRAVEQAVRAGES
jgi:hypothetical protein